MLRKLWRLFSRRHMVLCDDCGERFNAKRGGAFVSQYGCSSRVWCCCDCLSIRKSDAKAQRYAELRLRED